MIIAEKNSGEKIAYAVDKNKLTFDDDLTINLAKRESDSPVHIDVCFDADRNLVIGSAAGRRYVAEIDIPAREYNVTTKPNPKYDPEREEVNGNEKNLIEHIAKPFDMSRVTLTLWALNESEVGNE